MKTRVPSCDVTSIEYTFEHQFPTDSLLFEEYSLLDCLFVAKYLRITIHLIQSEREGKNYELILSALKLQYQQAYREKHDNPDDGGDVAVVDIRLCDAPAAG